MEKIFNYLNLYLKSLNFVWKTSKSIMLWMILMVPIQSILPSISIFITNIVVNKISSLNSINLTMLIAVWGVSFFLNNLISPLLVMIQGRMTDLLTYQLNTELMRKSERLQNISYFEDSEFYNDIQLLSSEASWRPVNLLVFGTSLISNAIVFASMLLMVSSVNILVSLLLFVVLIPQGIIAYRIQQQAFETLVSNSEESRKLDYYSQVLLSNNHIKDIRLYNLYFFFITKYTDVFTSITDKLQVDRRKKFTNSALFITLNSIVIILMFGYVIIQIKKGVLDLGVIFVFSTSIIYSINSMARLVEDSSLLYDTLLYMENFFKFIEIEDELSTEVPITKTENNFGDDIIEFRNVNFSYSNNSDLVLSNVSFKIAEGEKIAIVGENGAGKTTLVKLLCAFYPNYSGDIIVNNKSLREYELTDYRKQITSIFQDFSKFDISLRENVALSDLSRIFKNEDITKALDKGRFNMKDMSLDQVLGRKFDGGKELSGGEWQKVALSRAFFSNAPILILDEPTASIDAKAEYELFQDFLQLTQGKTVFYITHRLASVKFADKILVLKSGVIHSFGTHNELMNKDEYYRKLYKMQSSMYAEE
ncbi:Lipid A export ATP-binding/permease protein MsbA [Streptococcus oralis]|uniref:Lipid A export ATP-binding/permease protein MsbA n=3 Tax=Streptococcus TaxID=1301 RepID=A0A428II89_STROR|nr:ABC transporter ATP-binding protein [Streptococcus sanguinis]MCY7039659.1 ABC transporter ATP-binding protein/permease [Streptococcus sanguinis]RKV63106.1 MAG: ABC transporter ATP-binding protein [Streptococcus sp.]RSK17477.1 Lipid A export ATP-binding/permease protein MsbA [Streptococcus oralis]